MRRVALVSLGRSQAMGEVRRVSSWRQLFEAAGAEVVEVHVVIDHRLHLGGLGVVAQGHAAPERLAWSWRLLHAELTQRNPDIVVVISARAFDPHVVEGPWTVVLDQVDSLARSYRDRAAVVDGWTRRVSYRLLAQLQSRVERRLRTAPVSRVAAGWSEALALGAEWVPNIVDDALAPLSGHDPDVDVLFFGTLRYPPNVDALERLARCWPRILAIRPGTTALVAGSAPTDRVTDLCRVHGWELVADFPSLPEIAARARVAVAPLTRVAGIQNKVLDAAALEVPQVVTKEALEGFEPGIPLTPCAGDAEIAAETVRLLDHPDTARSEAMELRRFVLSEYGIERWSAWGAALASESGHVGR